MSLVKANSVQIGQSATATQNFTVTTGQDGTAKLARGNSGATSQDILTVDASGNVNAPVALQQAGTAVGRMVLSTAQNTTSGTAIDFTGIPSWAKRITIMFNGVSTNGSSNVQIQFGSGSIDSASYTSSSAFVSTTGNVCQAFTSSTGFLVNAGSLAACTFSGMCTISLMGSNTWTCAGNNTRTDSSQQWFHSGLKALSGTLDRVRITTVNGTDTFDAGSVNILYEG